VKFRSKGSLLASQSILGVSQRHCRTNNVFKTTLSL